MRSRSSTPVGLRGKTYKIKGYSWHLTIKKTCKENPETKLKQYLILYSVNEQVSLSKVDHAKVLKENSYAHWIRIIMVQSQWHLQRRASGPCPSHPNKMSYRNAYTSVIIRSALFLHAGFSAYGGLCCQAAIRDLSPDPHPTGGSHSHTTILAPLLNFYRCHWTGPHVFDNQLPTSLTEFPPTWTTEG